MKPRPVKVGDEFGRERVVRIEAGTTNDYYGQYALHCWVRCSDESHPERRVKVTLVRHERAPRCPACVDREWRGVRVIMPGSKLLTASQLGKEYPDCDIVVSEVRVRTARPVVVDIEDLPLKDQAIEYGRRGLAEAEIARKMDLEVKELRQLLRG